MLETVTARLERAVTPQLMEDFHRDGAVCIRQIFTQEEVALLRAGIPPRQNTCRSNRINEPGAMMRERIGKIRTSIQGQSSSAVAAAGERGAGRRCA